jgi:acyl-coenzyme A thioesterase PaaI-like protein
VPFRNRRSPSPFGLTEKDLSREEQDILARADAALAAGGNFIGHFWGEKGTLRNGLHAGNRVGHAQGGILIALAAKSAAAKLGAGWRLGAVTALYVSPGEGRTLRARSEMIHQGRLTAVVRTKVIGKNRRRVLEVLSTHAAATA